MKVYFSKGHYVFDYDAYKDETYVDENPVISDDPPDYYDPLDYDNLKTEKPKPIEESAEEKHEKLVADQANRENDLKLFWHRQRYYNDIQFCEVNSR